MEKTLLREILARNLAAAMEADPNIGTQQKLAAKARISQAHVSRLLLCEAAATLDIIAALSEAVKCQPWELIVDEHETRKAAIEKMLGPKSPHSEHPPGANTVVSIKRHKRRT